MDGLSSRGFLFSELLLVFEAAESARVMEGGGMCCGGEELQETPVACEDGIAFRFSAGAAGGRGGLGFCAVGGESKSRSSKSSSMFCSSHARSWSTEGKFSLFHAFP